MKRILFLAALATMVMACEKYTSDKPESSGVYLNGRCVVPIGSTFMGGGVAEPSKGSSHRCHMYEYGYEKGPGITYSKPGQFIDMIVIDGSVLKLDAPLVIPLEQGVYQGGCEQVSAVRIQNYDAGTVKNSTTGAMNDDGKIDMAISLTDGRTLRIHYRGKIPYDGYY